MTGFINLWAVLVSTVLGFGLGWLWYSKHVFGNIWMRETGVVCDGQTNGGQKAKMLGITIFLTLISAFVFALFLGPYYTFKLAIYVSFMISIGFITTSLGVNYLYLNRSLKLFLIDAGYYIALFLLFAVVFGLMK